jgi:hypothetical protein
MDLTLDGRGAVSPMGLTVPRYKGVVIGFWIVTTLLCLQIGALLRFLGADCRLRRRAPYGMRGPL